MGHRALFLTLLHLVLAGLALLGMGLFKVQRDYQTRGIPAGFPPATPHGGARLGINVYLQEANDEALNSTLQAIAALGIDAIKQPFYWNESGSYNWEMADRLVAAATAHGLELVPLLDGDPAVNFAPPASPNDFAAWAGEFARRYADDLRYYIIWDEPNLRSHWGNEHPNPADYAALLSAAATAIRAADPDAVIVAAPLAPTTESGPQNIAEHIYLERLYQAGAQEVFDVVAGKPYGFYTGPLDRRVNQQVLNFSRVILLREVMLQYGDEQKAVWAGNWGWNSLPAGWQGEPSLWGQATLDEQLQYTVAAWERAQQEWPWMGLMFLENWEPAAPAYDPVWGFSIAGRPVTDALATVIEQHNGIAYPGYHLAQPDAPGQVYTGTWRFSPEFGADISKTGDLASLRFWGTDVGMVVRRADYRARLYITIDGKGANALPNDTVGTALVLTSPSETDDYRSLETVARNLAPGRHDLFLDAWRGWDQWAVNAYSVAYHPPATAYRLTQVALFLAFVSALVLAVRSGREAEWGRFGQAVQHFTGRLKQGTQLLLTGAAALLVTATGWLTWGSEADGLYRRLGDVGQLALTGAAASLFYVTPAFFVYMAALAALFVLIYARPAWGFALVAFSFPFYVTPKPMMGYQFSPVEIFLLVTVAAVFLRRLPAEARLLHEGYYPERLRKGWQGWLQALRGQVGKADLAVLCFVLVATLSLLFTERLDVATNEWRVVIFEPALFYLLWRIWPLEKEEVWVILDAFILGGVFVAIYGLLAYAQGENIIRVESGLARLRSIYGSPNNVALYLGRIIPFLVGMLLFGNPQHGWRRWLWPAALLPIAPAVLLTFSKGAFFLGIPAALVLLLVLWRRSAGGPVWPWLLGLAAAGALALLAAFSIPAVSSRLNLQGDTSFLRVNLWRSSLNMIRDRPIFGVGLDNFLYAYRGRYILDPAWQEPFLNHPHNIILDFSTRLGLFGLLAGVWLFYALAGNLYRLYQDVLAPGRYQEWHPVIAALIAALAQTLSHGLVDHSFFLVDLAFVFFLMLGLALWLRSRLVPADPVV